MKDCDLQLLIGFPIALWILKGAGIRQPVFWSELDCIELHSYGAP